ncbi:MAG: YceI family protein [Hyphomicrobium sp.]|nr:YceI family protein [Hyphomicrobium sp.]
MMLRGLCLVICALSAMSASAAEYVIDTKGGHASINFRVQHLGFSWLTGRFDTFSGTFRYDETNPSASGISVTIDTKSVNSNHAERDKHLRGADFLDVATFPQATFVSKSVTADGNGKAVIAGEFTLRGITRPVAITAAYIGGGADPWGGFRHGFTGKTELVLSEFGIIRELGPAAKTVELEFHVEGIRK